MQRQKGSNFTPTGPTASANTAKTMHRTRFAARSRVPLISRDHSSLWCLAAPDSHAMLVRGRCPGRSNHDIAGQYQACYAHNGKRWTLPSRGRTSTLLARGEGGMMSGDSGGSVR
jgi:hypothetical protein